MENLAQLTPNRVVSDSILLRLNRRGLGVYKQPIYIDNTLYQILDPSAPNKWVHCLDVDVVIFVVSLTYYDYYQEPSTSSDPSGVREVLALSRKLD